MLKNLIGRLGARNYSPVAEAVETLRDYQMELADAQNGDTNLVRLRAIDPDAALIFDHGDFTRCLNQPDFAREFGRRIEAYAAAKHRAGEMHLYHQLFT